MSLGIWERVSRGKNAPAGAFRGYPFYRGRAGKCVYGDSRASTFASYKIV